MAPTPPLPPSPSPPHLPAEPPDHVRLCEGGGGAYFAGGLHHLFELCYAILPGEAPTIFTAKAGLLVTLGPPPLPGKRGDDEPAPPLLGRMVRPVRMGSRTHADKRAPAGPQGDAGGGGGGSSGVEVSGSSSGSRPPSSLFGWPPPKLSKPSKPVGGATELDPKVVWWEVSG